MEKPFVKFGLYYALTYIIGMFILYLVSPEILFNAYLGWAWMGLMLVAMILATRMEKMKFPEQFSFQQGFKQSWLTYALGSLLTMIFYHVLTHYIDPGLMDIQKEAQIEGVEKMSKLLGLSEENVEKQIQAIREQEGVSMGKIIFGFALSLILGAIPSLVVAAIFKKTPSSKSAV